MDLLDRGATLVVPSRQRAVAVRLAHSRAQLAKNVHTWPSCEVLTWSAWLERCAHAARFNALKGLRKLSTAEEWLLWREAAEQACEGMGVLLPETLADSLRTASILGRDWGLKSAGVHAVDGSLSDEARVLARAQAWFTRRCQELNAYSISDWNLVLSETAPVWFCGFREWGTALAQRLMELGGRIWPPGTDPKVDQGADAVSVVAGHDTADELRRAAQWCREQLQREPSARLLIVNPQLHAQRAAAIAAFEHELHGLSAPESADAVVFALEGGQPLSEFPLVTAAIDTLALSQSTLNFPQVSRWLRSPYLGLGTAAQRSELELRLRDRQITEANMADCVKWSPALFAASPSLGSLTGQHAGSRMTASTWAQHFALVLETCRWPGTDPLGSEEQQQRDRFRELLGELALLGGTGMRLSHGEALELLRALAARTTFDAASGDVPVTITHALEDPLVAYEGIWVMGLDSQSWPTPPRPDPYLAIGAQRAARMSHASPAGQLALAGLALQAWQRCTPKLVLSWPRFDGEVPLSASGLLTQAAGDEHGAAQQISVDRLLAALHASSGREPRPVARAVSWPVDRPLMGGTRALQLQSECPFRALAELRLGAAPVLDPMPGINPRERGQILHRSLELLWKDLVDSDSLRARGEDVGALETLARRVSAEAVRERLAGRAMALEAALAINEERRLSTLLMMLLQQELARAHLIEFTPIQLEQAQEYRVGGHAIRVRMDRLDRLPDGRTVVIDYKSGAAQSFRPLDERPRQAQLLVYALLAAHTAGAAAVHLNPDKIRWRGAAADQVLPDLPRPRAPTAPWPELMRHWRRVIDGLVHEFVAGVATVTPLPGACEHCHLAALCRVDAIALSAMDPDDERTGESHHER